MGWLGIGVLDRGGYRRRKVEALHCNQWGICDAAVLKLLRGLVTNRSD